VVGFLFALIELFRSLLWFRSYEAKCVQLGSFHREVDLVALKFYLDTVVLHQPFLASEN